MIYMSPCEFHGPVCVCCGNSRLCKSSVEAKLKMTICVLFMQLVQITVLRSQCTDATCQGCEALTKGENSSTRVYTKTWNMELLNMVRKGNQICTFASFILLNSQMSQPVVPF